MTRLLALASVLTGCLAAPDSPEVECNTTADCDTATGEVCEEGVCWGNPPAGPFAALIIPPSERKNEAVAREMTIASLPADGYFGELSLEEPLLLGGTVTCPGKCDGLPIDATIEVRRKSSIIGGPDFVQVASTDPRTGAFQLALPPGLLDYDVVVQPGKRGQPQQDGTSIAELVPPAHAVMRLDGNFLNKQFDLTDTTLFTISGSVVDAADNPVTNYRVFALGRFEAGGPLSEVSTVDFIGQTGGSTFSIQIPADKIVGSVEVVAQPFDGAPLPTLRKPITVVNQASTNNKLVLPSLGSGLEPVAIVVQGTETGGEVAGVLGARVTVSAKLKAPAVTTDTEISVDGTTDSTGSVILTLPGGVLASAYRVNVVPPPNATIGVVFNAELEQFPGTTAFKLPDRLALAGAVYGSDGTPLKDVQVTAHPSLRFQWSLENDPQAFVGTIPAATATTLEDGTYVLFVDPFLNDGMIDVWGFYDLQIEPTATTNAPAFVVPDFEIPRDTTLSQIAAPSTTLPDAAHVHGGLVDAYGDLVEGAELRLFRIEDQALFSAYCQDLKNPPATCPIPARLLGRGLSDKDGVARLTLPR